MEVLLRRCSREDFNSLRLCEQSEANRKRGSESHDDTESNYVVRDEVEDDDRRDW